MYYRYPDNRTDNERYLESELEREREQNERYRQEAQERREEYRRHSKEAMERWERSADSWHEAIQKQSALMWREVFPDDPENDFFRQSAMACDRALELWPKYAAQVEEEIERLEERVNKLRNSIRQNIGVQLEAERSTQGWKSIATSLQDPDEECDHWLDW